jgi:hypothetical protein
MQLVLATLQNRPVVYKMIRFDSDDPTTRQIVETVYIDSLADAETAAGSDWIAGKAMGVECREFQAGDILELSDGKIAVLTNASGAKVVFDANEYTGALPSISVDQTIIDAIQYRPNQPRIQSLVNGEMTLWP